MKVRVRHDLKKAPDLSITDYYFKKSEHRLSVGVRIVIGIVAFILLIRVMAGPFN